MSLNRTGDIHAYEYSDNKYDRIIVSVPKGRKALLKSCASAKGVSLNAFINRAIDNQLLRDT